MNVINHITGPTVEIKVEIKPDLVFWLETVEAPEGSFSRQNDPLVLVLVLVLLQLLQGRKTCGSRVSSAPGGRSGGGGRRGGGGRHLAAGLRLLQVNSHLLEPKAAGFGWFRSCPDL